MISKTEKSKVKLTINLKLQTQKVPALMDLSMSSPRGGGSGNPREFDCDAFQDGDFDLTSCINFDLSISKSR